MIVYDIMQIKAYEMLPQQTHTRTHTHTQVLHFKCSSSRWLLATTRVVYVPWNCSRKFSVSSVIIMMHLSSFYALECSFMDCSHCHLNLFFSIYNLSGYKITPNYAVGKKIVGMTKFSSILSCSRWMVLSTISMIIMNNSALLMRTYCACQFIPLSTTGHALQKNEK